MLSERLRGHALYDIREIFVTVALREFVQLFADTMSSGFSFGSVCDALGNRVEEYCTVLPFCPLLVRGGHQSRHQVCGTCGRFGYAPANDMYVLRQSLTGQSIYGCEIGGFVMTEELRRRIPRGAFRGVAIYRMDIADEPHDGLDSIPDNYFYYPDPPSS